MEDVQKQNFSFNIQERGVVRLKCFYNLTVVFWANVMNEQWQINNEISWKFLIKNPNLILKSNSRK